MFAVIIDNFYLHSYLGDMITFKIDFKRIIMKIKFKKYYLNIKIQG
jgi:hypothetical protein